MTIVNEAAEREAFIKAHPHLDLVEDKDAWGRPKFAHSHVDAIWAGWMDRAHVSHPSSAVNDADLREKIINAIVNNMPMVAGLNKATDAILSLLPPARSSAATETPTIDSIPSCGQENDYRRAQPADAALPAQESGKADTTEILNHADDLHDLGFKAGWNGAIEECAKIADDIKNDAYDKANNLSYGELYGMQCRADAAGEIAKAIRVLASEEKACDPGSHSAETDEGHPDCSTAREHELYDALMLVTSAAASRRPEWPNWMQGGVKVRPIVYKALRLASEEKA